MVDNFIVVFQQATIHNNEPHSLSKSNETTGKEVVLASSKVVSEKRDEIDPQKTPTLEKENLILTPSQKDQKDGKERGKVEKENYGKLDIIQQDQRPVQSEEKQQRESQKTLEIKQEPTVSIKSKDSVSSSIEPKLDNNEEEKVDDSTLGEFEKMSEHNADDEQNKIIDQHAGLNELASRAAEVSH